MKVLNWSVDVLRAQTTDMYTMEMQGDVREACFRTRAGLLMRGKCVKGMPRGRIS